MTEKKRGLGRGLGALIPSSPAVGGRTERPVDVFFPGAPAPARVAVAEPPGSATERPDPSDEAAEQNPSEADAADSGSTDPTSGDRDTHDATSGRPTPERSPAGDSDPEQSTVADASSGGANGVHGTSSSHRSSGDEDGQGADQGAAAHDDRSSVDDIDGLVPVPGASFAEVLLTQIIPNPRQPRTVFDEDALAELVHSIREIGVLQPIVVRPLTTREEAASGQKGARFELVMGERRWRASQEAGLETIPTIIRETADDDLLRDALLENLHRSDLNALEEAAAYGQLLEDFGCTHDELASRLGRSRPQISNTLRLLNLPPLVQRRVAAGVLSAGHARALLGLTDAGAMERLAQRIVAEGLSVRATEEIVALGGDPEGKPARRAARAGQRHEALDDLAGRLSDRLDTRVKIALGRSRGKITVDFASVEDLNRILEVLVPEEKGLFRP